MLLIGVAAITLAACSDDGPAPVGAMLEDVATEGLPGEDDGQDRPGGHEGAGVFEDDDAVDIDGGRASLVGQDVIVQGKIAGLLIGKRAFFVVPDEGGGSGGSSGGDSGGGSGSGGQEGGGSGGGGGGSEDVDCFAEAGTCLLVMLDAGIDLDTALVEDKARVELAGTVMALNEETIAELLDDETAGVDFERFPGRVFLLVRILETEPEGAG